MSNLTKFVMAVVGLVAMVVVASRQLFLFVVRDPSGLTAAGESHFWFAAMAGVFACVASGLMFYFFNRHETNKWSEVVMTRTGPLFTPQSRARHS